MSRDEEDNSPPPQPSLQTETSRSRSVAFLVIRVKLGHTSVDALDGRRRSVAVAVCLEPNFNTYKELRNRNNGNNPKNRQGNETIFAITFRRLNV